jgi:hypothetical protein
MIALFTADEDLQLEDGMERVFSKELVRLVMKYRGLAVQAIGSLVNGDPTSDEVGWEALRRMGRIEDRGTYYDRTSHRWTTLTLPNT